MNLLSSVCSPLFSGYITADTTYVMPKTTTANSENTVNVSYALDMMPFLWPKNPDDSANKYENGSNTNNDKFENRNT